MLKLNFWQSFNDNMSLNTEFSKYFNLRKPQPQHWYDLSIGTSSYFISLNINTQKKKVDAGIYIPNDKELFQKFIEAKALFQGALGQEIELRDAGKASRILISKAINVKDSSKWPEIANWFFEKSKVFKQLASEVDK
jgi:hypothetical protein